MMRSTFFASSAVCSGTLVDASIVNSADVMTLPVALIQFRGDYFSEYGQLMSGAFVSALPAIVIFLVAQRLIIRSITMTGLKG